MVADAEYGTDSQGAAPAGVAWRDREAIRSHQFGQEGSPLPHRFHEQASALASSIAAKQTKCLLCAMQVTSTAWLLSDHVYRYHFDPFTPLFRCRQPHCDWMGASVWRHAEEVHVHEAETDRPRARYDDFRTRWERELCERLRMCFGPRQETEPVAVADGMGDANGQVQPTRMALFRDARAQRPVDASVRIDQVRVSQF